VTAVEPTTDPASTSSRREVLCGLVVALLAPGALAAACGDSNSSGGSGGTPTGGGGATGGGTGGGGQALTELNDIPEGGGVVVENPSGGKVLIVRTSGDSVKAFNAACTHQGTPVNPPEGGTITCPNHGSQFDASTGALKRGPATVGLKEVSVKVEGTNVVLA
jgi:cytochrome b6-f complex iron-sulfur subunit